MCRGWTLWAAWPLIAASLWLMSPCQLSAQTDALQPQAKSPIVLGEEASFSREGAEREYVLLSRERRWEDLETLAGETARKDPADALALLWLGTARFQMSDSTGALSALRAAQKLGMESAELHLELGQVYYRLKQYKLFEEQMQLATRLEPRNGTAKYLLGFYYLSIKSDAEGALALLQEAAALQPDDPKVLYELGYCLESSGRADDAKGVYLRAIGDVAKSKQAFAWPLQGMARLLLNEDPQQALPFAKDAVSMQPGEARNHMVLAKVYERLGDFAQALMEASSAAAEDPGSASTRYFLYRLYRRSGKTLLAEQQLQRFEEINATYGPE